VWWIEYIVQQLFRIVMSQFCLSKTLFSASKSTSIIEFSRSSDKAHIDPLLHFPLFRRTLAFTIGRVESIVIAMKVTKYNTLKRNWWELRENIFVARVDLLMNSKCEMKSARILQNSWTIDVISQHTSCKINCVKIINFVTIPFTTILSNSATIRDWWR